MKLFPWLGLTTPREKRLVNPYKLETEWKLEETQIFHSLSQRFSIEPSVMKEIIYIYAVLCGIHEPHLVSEYLEYS